MEREKNGVRQKIRSGGVVHGTGDRCSASPFSNDGGEAGVCVCRKLERSSGWRSVSWQQIYTRGWGQGRHGELINSERRGKQKGEREFILCREKSGDRSYF